MAECLRCNAGQGKCACLSPEQRAMLDTLYPSCKRCGGDGWIRCEWADCLVCMVDNYCEGSIRCPSGCIATRARFAPNRGMP